MNNINTNKDNNIIHYNNNINTNKDNNIINNFNNNIINRILFRFIGSSKNCKKNKEIEIIYFILL